MLRESERYAPNKLSLLSESQPRHVLYSSEDDSSSSENMHLNNDNSVCNCDIKWFDPRGNQPHIRAFTSVHGVDVNNIKLHNCVNVKDFYALLVTEEMLENISKQTNIYAMQTRLKNTSVHFNNWVPTNQEEIKRFFGLIIWMGLVQYPSINLYWSKDPLFYHPFPHKIMSKNRFTILLRMLYFVNNESANTDNHLWEIQQIIDELNQNFKTYYNPSEFICIDEFVIPFCGQTVIRQYTKQNKNRYGIKVFKLCCESGYTYNLNAYSDGPSDELNMTPTNIVMNLCKDIFHKGHTLYTGSWYTSLDLAKQLIHQNTHLVGTLQNNCKGNSIKVVSKKLSHREFIAQESTEGITIMKLRKKRDVLLLSTKHSTEMEPVKRKTQFIFKPKISIDYTTGKKSIDHFNQLATYSNHPLLKLMKSYRKLGFELLFNISVINAFLIHQEVTGNKMSITTYRKKLVEALTQMKEEEIITSRRHKFEKKEGSAHEIRKYCVECYNRNSASFGSKIAKNQTKKVTTFCNTCKGKPHLCLQCFNKLHENFG